MIHRSVAFLLAVVSELQAESLGDEPTVVEVRDRLERHGAGAGLTFPQTVGGCRVRLCRADPQAWWDQHAPALDRIIAGAPDA